VSRASSARMPRSTDGESVSSARAVSTTHSRAPASRRARKGPGGGWWVGPVQILEQDQYGPAARGGVDELGDGLENAQMVVHIHSAAARLGYEARERAGASSCRQGAASLPRASVSVTTPLRRSASTQS
jgi:hypothetical protein